MEAGSTSEMSVNFYQTAQHNHPEDSHLHRFRIFENSVLRRIFGSDRGSDRSTEKIEY
jgi:hypothetical protein